MHRQWCQPRSRFMPTSGHGGDFHIVPTSHELQPNANEQLVSEVSCPVSLSPSYSPSVFRECGGRADGALPRGTRQFLMSGTLGDGFFRIHSLQMFTLFRINYVFFSSDLLFMLYIVPRAQGNVMLFGFPCRIAPTKLALVKSVPTP